MPKKDLPYEPGDIEEAVQKYWEIVVLFLLLKTQIKKSSIVLACFLIQVAQFIWVMSEIILLVTPLVDFIEC